MSRIKSPAFKKHKKLFKLISKNGFSYKKNNEKSLKAFRYNYQSRKKNLNFYRKSWISNINIFLKTFLFQYSNIFSQLKKFNILLNKKMISQEIIMNPLNFLALFYTLFYKSKSFK